MKCSVCTVTNNLKVCGGCHLVLYCGVECQKQDYPLHPCNTGIDSVTTVLKTSETFLRQNLEPWGISEQRLNELISVNPAFDKIFSSNEFWYVLSKFYRVVDGPYNQNIAYRDLAFPRMPAVDRVAYVAEVIQLEQPRIMLTQRWLESNGVNSDEIEDFVKQAVAGYTGLRYQWYASNGSPIEDNMEYDEYEIGVPNREDYPKETKFTIKIYVTTTRNY